MLNIISRAIVTKRTRGPRKVVSNLILGLEELGYPYVVNADLKATDTLWIHDDPAALAEAVKLPSPACIIAGPNIFTLTTQIPKDTNLERVIWLHPASWVKDFWDSSGRKIESLIWPVGIDTKTFAPIDSPEKDLVIVYNKQRSTSELDVVCEALEARKQRFTVLTYGYYQETSYRDLLKKAKAIVWVGRSESQGIALLEALSMNVPALVWDVHCFGQWTGSGHERYTEAELAFSGATTIPYFDARCGRRFIETTDLNAALDEFLNSLPTLSPRTYIEENLSLAKQTTAFLNIYKTHFNQSDAHLRNTTLRTTKKWKNARFYFIFYQKIIDLIKRIIG